MYPNREGLNPGMFFSRLRFGCGASSNGRLRRPSGFIANVETLIANVESNLTRQEGGCARWRRLQTLLRPSGNFATQPHPTQFRREKP